MKKLIILFFSIFSLFSYSQEDFKKKIAQNTCKCVKDVKKENLTKKQIEFQFGICMFKVANPYKAEIKKEFGIDISDFSKKENMYKLGTEIGILMAQECPDVFEQFIPEDKNDTQTEEVVSS